MSFSSPSSDPLLSGSAQPTKILQRDLTNNVSGSSSLLSSAPSALPSGVPSLAERELEYEKVRHAILSEEFQTAAAPNKTNKEANIAPFMRAGAGADAAKVPLFHPSKSPDSHLYSRDRPAGANSRPRPQPPQQGYQPYQYYSPSNPYNPYQPTGPPPTGYNPYSSIGYQQQPYGQYNYNPYYYQPGPSAQSGAPNPRLPSHPLHQYQLQAQYQLQQQALAAQAAQSEAQARILASQAINGPRRATNSGRPNYNNGPKGGPKQQVNPYFPPSQPSAASASYYAGARPFQPANNKQPQRLPGPAIAGQRAAPGQRYPAKAADSNDGSYEEFQFQHEELLDQLDGPGDEAAATGSGSFSSSSDPIVSSSWSAAGSGGLFTGSPFHPFSAFPSGSSFQTFSSPSLFQSWQEKPANAQQQDSEAAQPQQQATQTHMTQQTQQSQAPGVSMGQNPSAYQEAAEMNKQAQAAAAQAAIDSQHAHANEHGDAQPSKPQPRAFIDAAKAGAKLRVEKPFKSAVAESAHTAAAAATSGSAASASAAVSASAASSTSEAKSPQGHGSSSSSSSSAGSSQPHAMSFAERLKQGINRPPAPVVKAAPVEASKEKEKDADKAAADPVKEAAPASSPAPAPVSAHKAVEAAAPAPQPQAQAHSAHHEVAQLVESAKAAKAAPVAESAHQAVAAAAVAVAAPAPAAAAEAATAVPASPTAADAPAASADAAAKAAVDKSNSLVAHLKPKEGTTVWGTKLKPQADDAKAPVAAAEPVKEKKAAAPAAVAAAPAPAGPPPTASGPWSAIAQGLKPAAAPADVKANGKAAKAKGRK